MSDPQKMTYAELANEQEEIVRRGKIIMDRLKKMEFTGSGAEHLTTVAAIYAVLIHSALSGIPLHIVVQVSGFIYQLSEEVQTEALWARLKQHILMNLPDDKKVM